MLQSLQTAQQAQAEADDKKYSTEIEKTKIAHASQGSTGMGMIGPQMGTRA